MKIKIIQFLIIAFTFVGCREDARFSKEHIKEREKIDAELAAEKKADAERFFGISCDLFAKGGITITFDKKRNLYFFLVTATGIGQVLLATPQKIEDITYINQNLALMIETKLCSLSIDIH